MPPRDRSAPATHTDFDAVSASRAVRSTPVYDFWTKHCGRSMLSKRSEQCGRQRATGEERFQVRQHIASHLDPGFLGRARLVRLEDDVVEAEQGFGHVRLVDEHVEAGGAEPPLLQGRDERGLV